MLSRRRYRVAITRLSLVGAEFNAPLDTIEVISEAVFTANHLTDTDKQNSTGKYRQTNSIQIRKSKQPKIQQNKTTPVQLPLTTLGQETRWAYFTTPPSPHGAPLPGYDSTESYNVEALPCTRSTTFRLFHGDRASAWDTMPAGFRTSHRAIKVDKFNACLLPG